MHDPTEGGHEVPDYEEMEFTESVDFVSKLLGPDTTKKVRQFMKAVQKMEPKELLATLDWVVESWPVWKEKAAPYIAKYSPVVKDVVKTLGEVLEPLIDAPGEIILGQGIRSMIRDERAFRKDLRETLKEVQHFLKHGRKTYVVKTDVKR